MQIQNLFYTICSLIFSMLISSCVVPSDNSYGGDGPHIRIEPGVDLGDLHFMTYVAHNNYNTATVHDSASAGDTLSLHPALNGFGFAKPFDNLVVSVLVGYTEVQKKNLEVDSSTIRFVIPQNCSSGWLQVVSITNDQKRFDGGMYFDTVGGSKLTIR